MTSRNRAIFFILLLLPCCLLSALEKQSNSDYHARRVRLAQALNGSAAVLFAAEEPQLDFMPYRQDEDFYYLTGWNEPGAALLIEPAISGHLYREILLLPTRNLHTELYTGEKLDAASTNISQITGVDEVKPLTELPSLLNDLLASDRRAIKNIWSEPDTPQAKALLTWTAATLATDAPLQFQDVRDLTGQLRIVKDSGELALIRKASDASIQAQIAMMKTVHPGATERAVTGVIISKLMENGCERVSYSPIVGSGKNSTTLHYSDSTATMQDGDVTVVDAAGEYSMYASDITRTVPVNGHFTARQREIYNIVLGAQQAAIEAFVADKSIINDPKHIHPDSLDIVAWNYMNAHGKDLHGEPIGKYFIHGIGHSVGINVHDPWDYSKPVEKGMVFTIEPGIYIPEEKIGVRIEDIFYVNENSKLECLTCALPKTTEAVEKTMRK